MASKKPLPSLSFRDFLTYREVESFVTRLADARPDLARLHSLGPSREGRQVYCLTITDFRTGAPEDKPAYLIHGNIHACELSGTHAALYTARRLVADHPRRKALLRETVFHIVPRLNPDGAEWVATTCGYVRSRTDRTHKEPNTLYQCDVNGDGLILDMIWEHPDGTLVKDPKAPELLVARKADSPPPYYRRVIEGTIHQWDGSDDFRVEGRSIDWNRQIHSMPNLFGALGYHNGPAAVLRPPSIGGDDQMDAGDLRAYEDLTAIAAKHTGFPVIPVVKYHSRRSRDIRLYGHFPATGYHHLGLFVIEIELGMIHNSAGFSTEDIFAASAPEEAEERLRKVLHWWRRRGRPMPLFHPWKPFDHPQLGRVQIGGLNRKYMAGPLLSDLRKICAGTYRFTVEHAAKRPRVVLEPVAVEALGEDIYRVRARVANRGEFPTNITNRGKQLRRLHPARVRFEPGAGVEVLSWRAHHDLGHLTGVSGGRMLEWFVRGPEGAACRLDVLGGTGGNTRREIVLGGAPRPAS